MKEDELFKFYESQYHFEDGRRDKINARLQIPFAIIVAIAGLLAFMLQNVNHYSDGAGVVMFWLLFGCATAALCFAIYYFRLSWFGHTDKLIPTPQALDEYRALLIDYYSDQDNSNELTEKKLKETLFNYYIEFTSTNATNNDRRSYNIYRTTVSLTIAAILAFVAYVPFYMFNLDKSSGNQTYKVEVTNFKKLNDKTQLISTESDSTGGDTHGRKKTATTATTTEKRKGRDQQANFTQAPKSVMK